MGSVEVLRPQDALQKRFNYRDSGFVNSAMKSKRNFSSNPNPNPKHGHGFGKSDRRRRSPQKNSNSSGTGNIGVSFSGWPPETKGSFVVGQVRILKRGEGLGDTAPFKKTEEKVETKGCVEKVESQSKTTSKKKFNIADFYAGSACDSSPPPSSLPVPGFFKKKNIFNVENNDYATCDLRRLLRLDLS